MKASTGYGSARTSVIAAVAVALVAAVGGCIKIEDKGAPKAGNDGEASWADDMTLGAGGLSFEGDAVVLERGGSKARIAADGSLAIDGKAVTVDAAQRAELVTFHGAARQLRSNALATGREGVQLAKDVVSDVLTGIAKGDTSGIERNAELKAANVKRAAARLCDDLESMRGAQDRVAGSLAEFKPFATIDPAAVADCRKDTAADAAPDPALASAPPVDAAASTADSTSDSPPRPSAPVR